MLLPETILVVGNVRENTGYPPLLRRAIPDTLGFIFMRTKFKKVLVRTGNLVLADIVETWSLGFMPHVRVERICSGKMYNRHRKFQEIPEIVRYHKPDLAIGFLWEPPRGDKWRSVEWRDRRSMDQRVLMSCALVDIPVIWAQVEADGSIRWRELCSRRSYAEEVAPLTALSTPIAETRPFSYKKRVVPTT